MSEQHLLLPLARRWSAYAHFADGDRDAVLDLPFTHRPFGKDAYLVREGQKTSECALLIKGYAFRH